MTRLKARIGLALLCSLFGVNRATAYDQADKRETVLRRLTPSNIATVDYDMGKNQNNGAMQDRSGYQYKLGYKQGERDSPSPVKVATISLNHNIGHPSPPSLQLQIISRSENKPKSTAYYKVAVSIIKPGDPDKLLVTNDCMIQHKFDVMIDPAKFQIEDKAPVMFEEFWQGSPFSAPVSLSMISPADARAAGWPNIGQPGNYTLTIKNDDHEPLSNLGSPPLVYNLGPIELGRWMSWQVRVTPNPTGRGVVEIIRNGETLLTVRDQKVGFDPANPEYGAHKPSKQFDDVDLLLYRKNGSSFQTMYVSDISLSVYKDGCRTK